MFMHWQLVVGPGTYSNVGSWYKVGLECRNTSTHDELHSVRTQQYGWFLMYKVRLERRNTPTCYVRTVQRVDALPLAGSGILQTFRCDLP